MSWAPAHFSQAASRHVLTDEHGCAKRVLSGWFCLALPGMTRPQRQPPTPLPLWPDQGPWTGKC